PSRIRPRGTMEEEESGMVAAAAPPPPEGGGRRQLARRAGLVSAGVLASRILGLVREQTFAVLFGAGRELDAFVTAFRIPNLMRDLFAEGALSAAFVTTFTQRMEKDGTASAWRLANLVVNALAVVVGLVTLLGICFAPALVDFIAPGFAEIPGKTELTVTMTRIMFPFLLLVALAAVAMGVLNTCNVFGIPAAASAFFTLGSIIGGLGAVAWIAPGYVESVFGGGRGEVAPDAAARAITGMAIGTLVGGLLQLLVQVPALYRVGFRWRPSLDAHDAGLRQVLRLMGPATVGAAAVQVNVLVNSNFASYLGDGPVSWLNVAFRFMQLPIGLFGVALGTVALPAVSRHRARGDTAALGRTVGQALELVALLCLPAAAGLAVFGVPVIGLVYEHGRFGPADTTAAAQALAAYAVGLAGYAGIKVLAPAFYALDDTRVPMLVSILSIVTNFVLNWTFVRVLGFGHVGLALSTSAVDAVASPLFPAAGTARHALRLLVAIPVSGAVLWSAARVLGIPVPRL